MNTFKGITTGAGRWLVAAVALAIVAGASDAALAKERQRERTSERKSKAEGAGYIGIYMQELTDDVRKGLDLDVKTGVLVSGVEDDSPAAEAGLEEGDVIVSINGAAVATPDDLRDAIAALSPGTGATLGVSRGGSSRAVEVVVGERPDRRVIRIEGDGRGPWRMHGDDFAPMHEMTRAFALAGGPRLGVQAHEIEDESLAKYFGVKKGEGVLVLGVEEGSVAEKAGVKAGDVIRAVGEEKVADVQDLRSALRDYEEGDQFDIGVLRHGKAHTLKATMDDQAHEFAFEVPAPEAFKWHHMERAPRAPKAPKVWVDKREIEDDLRREMDELKREMRELKDQLQKQHDG